MTQICEVLRNAEVYVAVNAEHVAINVQAPPTALASSVNVCVGCVKVIVVFTFKSLCLCV